MLPDRVSNPGPLTYESGALPIALRGPAPCITNGLVQHITVEESTSIQWIKVFNFCDDTALYCFKLYS